jgi:hypothetical protein
MEEDLLGTFSRTRKPYLNGLGSSAWGDTIHVTTPNSRQAYLIEGSEKLGLSHTGPQIAKELLKVMHVASFLDPNL